MATTTTRIWTLRALPLLVLIVAGVLLATSYRDADELKAGAFGSLMLTLEEHTRNELDRLFSPVSTQISIASTRLSGESPPLDQPLEFAEGFLPLLKEVPQISSVLLADNGGREVMILRTENGWLTRLINVSVNPGKASWQRLDQEGKSTEAWEESLAYDPRERPWFRGAVDSAEPDQLHWTEPYRFFTTKTSGITAATSWAAADNADVQYVLAFDVLLASISDVTRQLQAGEAGKAFVFTGGGKVIGVPSSPQFDDPDTLQATMLTSAAEFPLPEIRTAYNDWVSQGRPVSNPFPLTIDGSIWWAGFNSYPLNNRSIWFSVVVPEAELSAYLGGTNNVLPIAIGVIGILLFLGSLLLVRHFSKDQVTEPRESVVKAAVPNNTTAPSDITDPGGRIRELIGEGEHERLEFKSTIRWNLKANRAGKEIELAWLKTVVAFLNTDGGAILIGIRDDGEILGLKQDNFKNDDQMLRHIENLISRHVGNEFFPYVRVRSADFDGKGVVMIQCAVSPKPAFLKHDKGEEFYLRTGPASRSLSAREVLTYLESRGQRSA